METAFHYWATETAQRKKASTAAAHQEEINKLNANHAAETKATQEAHTEKVRQLNERIATLTQEREDMTDKYH